MFRCNLHQCADAQQVETISNFRNAKLNRIKRNTAKWFGKICLAYIAPKHVGAVINTLTALVG